MSTGDTAGGNPAMDWHPIQGGVVILLVTSCWVSCDGLASHPGGSSNTPSQLLHATETGLSSGFGST